MSLASEMNSGRLVNTAVAWELATFGLHDGLEPCLLTCITHFCAGWRHI